jgi:hypothetical protein
MPMQKQLANKILTSLDHTANRLEELAKTGKVDQSIIAGLVKEIDGFSDKFQIAAFGKESFERHQAKFAKVIQRDADEKFMDTFDNPNKVIQSDADESYMHRTPASFNNKAMDSYDQDQTSTVSDRDEFAVRDLSEHANPVKRQPSWPRGPAGKSTKQGSTLPKSNSVPEKQWA